jgi:hypothetical protein
VVKALCYKSESRWFEIRLGERIFSIYLILPAALGPGVYSASNRNEYQKQKNNVSGGVERGRCVGLTTLPSSVSRLYRQCGILNISQPYRSPRPVMGILIYSLHIYPHGDSFTLLTLIHIVHIYPHRDSFTLLTLIYIV